MPIQLFRIDDRLIHGQVVVGWGQPMGLAFVVLVDDEVAASEWEQELYRMGVPPEMDAVFASVEEAAYEEAVRSYQQLSTRAQCELDGTCGTGDAGDGLAYQGAKAAADAQAGVVAAAKIRFDGAVTAFEDAAARSR